MSKQSVDVKMTPSHPGAFIREEVIDELNLSITKAAEVLGVRRASLSDLLNEKASLSPEMALRLEKAFGLSMELLLKMQAWYDAVKMRSQTDKIQVEQYEPA